ncbi:hypothetical protein CYMTET_33705, partial [Cymbomonas tetramitiformis]
PAPESHRVTEEDHRGPPPREGNLVRQELQPLGAERRMERPWAQNILLHHGGGGAAAPSCASGGDLPRCGRLNFPGGEAHVAHGIHGRKGDVLRKIQLLPFPEVCTQNSLLRLRFRLDRGVPAQEWGARVPDSALQVAAAVARPQPACPRRGMPPGPCGTPATSLPAARYATRALWHARNQLARGAVCHPGPVARPQPACPRRGMPPGPYSMRPRWGLHRLLGLLASQAPPSSYAARTFSGGRSARL